MRDHFPQDEVSIGRVPNLDVHRHTRTLQCLGDSVGDHHAQGGEYGEELLSSPRNYHQVDLERQLETSGVLEMFPSLSEHLPQPWNPVRGFGSSDPNPAGSTSHPVQLCLFASVLQFPGPARILETVSPKLSVGPYLKSHHRTRLLSSCTLEGLE